VKTGKPEEIKMSRREEFEEERARLNAWVFQEADLPIQQFFALDSQVYEDGALSRKTKELLGLVASLALRGDFIAYHLIQAREQGVTKAEAVDLVVGGSIVIPPLSWAFLRASELWG
jgi:alkylhydroperoxidase/carboxymuconolactone decarboxylase family protein YurZ